MNRFTNKALLVITILIASASYRADAVLLFTATGPAAIVYGIVSFANIGIAVPNRVMNGRPVEAVLASALGIVALNAGKQTLVFSPIEQKDAAKFSLTDAELNAYNDELPLINLISDQMARVTEAQDVSSAAAGELYLKTADEVGLSQPARSALAKVVAASLKQ